MSRKKLVVLGTILFAIACQKGAQQPPPGSTATTATTATIATTATTGTVPQPEHDYKLDHFKFWKLQEPIPFHETMQLLGQCDGKKPWKAFIGPARYIGNPVVKTHLDGDKKRVDIKYQLHYIAYSIVGKEESQPKRKVTFSNQFTHNEQQTWTVDGPEYLLVPAGKTLEGEPQAQQGDHFACYPVIDPHPVEVNVTLEDEIDTHLKRVEPVKLLMPKYFCMPVEKRREGKDPEPRRNPDSHLAIYSFKGDTLKPPMTVNSIDQLTKRQRPRIQQSEWLAVPSLKSKCEPAD